VTRLYDRILDAGGCKPFNLTAYDRSHALTPPNTAKAMRDTFIELGLDVGDIDFDRLAAASNRDPSPSRPTTACGSTMPTRWYSRPS
jgi:hypothetical protein